MPSNDPEYARNYMRKYMRNYRKTPRRKAIEAHNNAKRRCKKFGNIIATDENELNNIRKLYRVCAYANLFMDKHTFEVDHIVPIVKGGSHTLNNLQILTAEENRAKNNK